METNTTTQLPGNGTTFVPLPGGAPVANVTAERIREQLGWTLLQPGRR